MAILGMTVVVLGYAGYLAMLFVLRRFTYRTWLFHAVIVVGIALALIGLAVGDAGPAAWIAIVLGVAWFPVTARELTLVGSERLQLKPGDPVPTFTALRTDRTPITDQDVVAHTPALLVLYRGWWCPSTRVLLDELLQVRDRLTSAGLTIFAASVDPPEQAIGHRAVRSRCPPRSSWTLRVGSYSPTGLGGSTTVPAQMTSWPRSPVEIGRGRPRAHARLGRVTCNNVRRVASQPSSRAHIHPK